MRAALTATELDTGVAYRASTGATGIYVFPFLPPGRYRVALAHPGFKSYERSTPSTTVSLPCRARRWAGPDSA